MNLKELGKEQKQRIALGGIGAVVIVAIIFFGIKVSLSSITEAKLELDGLAGKVESADRALAKQAQVRKEFAESMVVLKEYLRDAPPKQNYYSWATETIHAKAWQSNLEIDAIDEQSLPGSSPSGGTGKALNLEPYSLRIAAHGGYEDLKQFLTLMEKDHPLSRVVVVDVSTGSDPEIHSVQLVVEWPFNLSAVADAWVGLDLEVGVSKD